MSENSRYKDDFIRGRLGKKGKGKGKGKNNGKGKGRRRLMDGEECEGEDEEEIEVKDLEEGEEEEVCIHEGDEDARRVLEKEILQMGADMRADLERRIKTAEEMENRKKQRNDTL